MASKDKMLARVSDLSTLAMLAGMVALLFLPAHKSERAAATAGRPRVEARLSPQASPAAKPHAEQATTPAPPPVTPPQQQSAPSEPAVDAWSEAEQAAGLRECLRLLAPVAADVELEEPMKKGPCGTPAPVLLHSIGSAAKVEFHPAPEMNCRLAAKLSRWVEQVLQPAAREVLGSRITRIVGASAYSCRHMYSKPDLPLSQHATGSAVDIAGFVTADGRRIVVAKGWGPTERDIVAAKKKAAAKAAAEKSGKETTTADAKVHKAGYKADKSQQSGVVTASAVVTAAKTSEAAFLKRLHHGACAMFGTVLGPEANDAHRDHFHFDVKERKSRGICH